MTGFGANPCGNRPLVKQPALVGPLREAKRRWFKRQLHRSSLPRGRLSYRKLLVLFSPPFLPDSRNIGFLWVFFTMPKGSQF